MTHTLDDVDDRLASLEISLPSFAAYGRDWALNNRNLWTELNADRGENERGAVCSTWTALVGFLPYPIHIQARMYSRLVLLTPVPTSSPHFATKIPLLFFF